ncbi:DMT family transporter [Kutzneria viridogrisea]|uniref:Drug/metabolite transporter (DMT)-like permease n=1 Tax=Kutzneria viridogrisea TaxID=47990 RepID=A0ABR6BSF2_9PSEU|nr:drug/metabolite transporter (DMT)-like permease [Kutzneria viridogrisea]
MDSARFDPRVMAALGASVISLSAILTRLSGTTPATVAFFRGGLALLVLIPLAVWERRRTGARWRWADLVGGLLLGLDFVLWGQAILDVGAGIATVMVGVQVLVLPLLSLALNGERPGLRFWLTVPVILGGVALAAGLADTTAFGEHPVRGVLFGTLAGVAYGVYLFLLRRGGQSGQRYTPVCTATVGTVLLALVTGGLVDRIDFTPGWTAFAWLVVLALSAQVLGWLLIANALPRLSSSVGATLLMIQPVGAVLFGMLLLHERPGTWQLVGCAAVVAAVWVTAMSRQPRSSSASAVAGSPAGDPAGHQPVGSAR